MPATTQKILVFLVILTLGLQLAACTATGNVQLCDYKHIVIPEETVTVPDGDVLLSIQMQITEQNPDLEIDALTDDLAKQYFNLNCAEDVYAAVRAEIAEHRAYDYAYAYLLNNSLLRSNNPDRQAYVQKIIQQAEENAAGSNRTIDEYLHTEFGMVLFEYRNDIGAFYDEFLILQEFAKAEGIEIAEEEFNEYLRSMASDSGVTVEALLEQYSEEVILYSIYLERSYDALLEYLTY